MPEVQADREGAAVSLAEKYHCVAVLKGHHTLVAAPDGTVWRNETGNAGLAKGGSGDILAGLTAGLLAAGLKQGPHARGRRGLRGMAPRRRCRPLRQAPQHDRHAAGGSV
ncbi:ADP-dependent NAD(P)H-hydrate dehydratase [Gemmiger formicilis]|uniref:ADP-dependent NAD(P)H-hydrate dehydratase n=1 Tax=Gemmiger formicilis TaxID=745368 RepID=UPI0035217051